MSKPAEVLEDEVMDASAEADYQLRVYILQVCREAARHPEARRLLLDAGVESALPRQHPTWPLVRVLCNMERRGDPADYGATLAAIVHGSDHEAGFASAAMDEADKLPATTELPWYVARLREALAKRVTADQMTDLLSEWRNGTPSAEITERGRAILSRLESAGAPATHDLEPLDLTQATADVDAPIEFGTPGGEVLSVSGDLDIEAGEVGAGKSLAMALRCCAKVLGKPWFGFPCAAPGRATLVCADGEGPGVVRFRLSRIAAGLKVTLEHLHAVGLQVIVPERFNLDDPGTFATFQKMVEAHDPDLIGVDSLNAILGPDRDPYQAADVGSFIRLRLRPLQLRGERPRRSLSVAHHLRKRQGTPGGNAIKDRVAGSYYTIGGMDAAFGLEPSGEESFIFKSVKRSRWGTSFKAFLVRLEGKGKEPLTAVNTGALKPSDAETAALENDVLKAANALSGPDGWVKVGDVKRHLNVRKEDGRRGKAVERAAKRLAEAGKLESHATIRGCFRVPRQSNLPDSEDDPE